MQEHVQNMTKKNGFMPAHILLYGFPKISKLQSFSSLLCRGRQTGVRVSTGLQKYFI